MSSSGDPALVKVSPLSAPGWRVFLFDPTPVLRLGLVLPEPET